MDEATRLGEMQVDDHTKLGDVAWNTAQLTRVSWPACLGDELEIAQRAGWIMRTSALHTAARAYRGLALPLRQQGMLERAST